MNWLKWLGGLALGAFLIWAVATFPTRQPQEQLVGLLAMIFLGGIYFASEQLKEARETRAALIRIERLLVELRPTAVGDMATRLDSRMRRRARPHG